MSKSEDKAIQADDIVTRLRNSWWNLNPSDIGLCKSAADEIEHLRQELADWQRTVRALEGELAMSDKWRDNYALGLEDSQKTVKHWYGIAQRLREEGRCRHCEDYPAVFHEECLFRDFDEIANG